MKSSILLPSALKRESPYLSSHARSGRSSVPSQSCDLLTFCDVPNAAIFVTIKSQTSGRNQPSSKLGTSTLSTGLKLGYFRSSLPSVVPTSHLLYSQMFSRLCPSLRSPGSMFSFYRPTFWFRYFLGLFSSLHIAIMHTIFHPSYRTISTAPPLISFLGPLGTNTFSPSHYHERHLMFIHGTLLYLSLDGVIPEAFIYAYIPYNISCASSVDRTGDKLN